MILAVLETMLETVLDIVEQARMRGGEILPILVISLLLSAGGARLHAQATSASASLPDAPGLAGGGQQTPSGDGLEPHSGSISGTVLDSSGAPVPGAQVMVSGPKLPQSLTATTDAAGAFRITALPSGSFAVAVAATPGFLPAAPETVVLARSEQYKLTLTVIPTPRSSTTVHVFATPDQIATAQVKLEEKQRVLGIVPNFYTSYSSNAAPMTTRLKYNLVAHSILDPITFVVVGGVAGAEQIHNTYPGYGRGTQGYAKRYGSTFADTAIARLLGDAALPAIFHQDPRYFYRGTGSTGSRMWYAIQSTVVVKGDSGRWQPACARILGNFAAAVISNLYHTPGDRGAAITFRDGLIITADGAVENLLREFLPRTLTTNVPPDAKGKDAAATQP
jgi:hypothetical protein